MEWAVNQLMEMRDNKYLREWGLSS
jgi:hypothetical protein